MRCHRRVLLISSCLLTVALTACHGYVKKADFDSTVAELRANDQKQQQEIDGPSVAARLGVGGGRKPVRQRRDDHAARSFMIAS